MSASCSITGPYANRTASEPSRTTRPRPGSSSPSSSMRRGDGPMASRIATFPSASSTAQRTTARVSSAFAGCTIVIARKRSEQRDVTDALVRLPRAGGDQARVVEGVDDLRPLARLVVDLLVRSRREERRERVDDREDPVARHARRRGDHVLLGDAALDEPIGVGQLERAHAAVRGEVRVEHDEVLVGRGRARRALRRTPRRRTRR